MRAADRPPRTAATLADDIPTCSPLPARLRWRARTCLPVERIRGQERNFEFAAARPADNQPRRATAANSAAQRTAVRGQVALQELVPAGDELQVALCVCQYPAGLDHNGAAVGESHVARQADVTIDTGGEVECVHPISGVGQADPAGRVCPAELEMVQRVIQIPADVVEELHISREIPLNLDREAAGLRVDLAERSC